MNIGANTDPKASLKAIEKEVKAMFDNGTEKARLIIFETTSINQNKNIVAAIVEIRKDNDPFTKAGKFRKWTCIEEYLFGKYAGGYILEAIS